MDRLGLVRLSGGLNRISIRHDDAESDRIVPIRALTRIATSRTIAGRVRTPSPAPNHAQRPRGRDQRVTSARKPLNFRVLAPLPHVPVHIVKPERIRTLA